MPPAENLLITELVALDIVSGSSKSEESTPGGETNDGDDRRRDDGVIIAVVATTVLSKTLSGDNGEEHFGFETFVQREVLLYIFRLANLLNLECEKIST